MNKLANHMLIWKLLVGYANTGDNFRTLFFTCMNYCGTVGADSVTDGDLSVAFAGRKRGSIVSIVIDEKGDSAPFCRDVRNGLTLEDGAKKYKRDFKRVLTWLTDRNSKERKAALAFLWTLGRDVVIDASVDDDLYSQTICEYGTVASPICKFILERMDHYNEGRKFIAVDEKATSDLSYNDDLRRDVLPIGLCKHCGKFMVIERSSKQFCSDLCRAESGQAKKTKAQRAKEMREYRRVKALQASRRKRSLHGQR
jgi:hypothetical protein